MAMVRPVITGWSNFWSDLGDMKPYDLLPLAADGGRSPLEMQLARILNAKQMREFRAVAVALNGVAPGANATSTYKREKSPVGPDSAIPGVTAIDALGGNIVIETVTAVNRNTTTADKNYINDVYSGRLLERQLTVPTSYPTDPSGNSKGSANPTGGNIGFAPGF